jgi:hypothetical protein
MTMLGSDRLYNQTPMIGLVIGTYAAVSYVWLQLEARKRFYPHVPVFVHDDGSHKRNRLKYLCDVYEVEFSTNKVRLGHTMGDLSTYIAGLEWARDHGIDLLLKVSRRWLFLVDWTTSLLNLAMWSQYATIGTWSPPGKLDYINPFHFRTECLGLSVKAWSQDWVQTKLTGACRKDMVRIELFMHDLAKHLEKDQCDDAKRWRISHPVDEDKRGYAIWDFIGTSRHEREGCSHIMWHGWSSYADYHELAMSWGSPFSEQSFADPNHGMRYYDQGMRYYSRMPLP